MMIMPSNNSSGIVHYFAGKYPGKIGSLFSPNGWCSPNWYMPYALDNGCFKKWEEVKFFKMLRESKWYHAPLWVCVPDVVADAENTLKLWHKYNKSISDLDFRLAFVVQDGMEISDVPKNAYAVFVGGSTDWKLANAHKFKGITPWLHIGRVNTARRIHWAKKIGAESVDGTGFFRSKGTQYRDFIEYYEGSIYKRKNKLTLNRNNPGPYRG